MKMNVRNKQIVHSVEKQKKLKMAKMDRFSTWIREVVVYAVILYVMLLYIRHKIRIKSDCY